MAGSPRIWSEPFLGPFRDAGFTRWTLTLPGRPAGPIAATDPDALAHRRALLVERGDLRALLDDLASALADVWPGTSAFDGPDLEALTDAVAAALKDHRTADGAGLSLAWRCHRAESAAPPHVVRGNGPALFGAALRALARIGGNGGDRPGALGGACKSPRRRTGPIRHNAGSPRALSRGDLGRRFRGLHGAAPRRVACCRDPRPRLAALRTTCLSAARRGGGRGASRPGRAGARRDCDGGVVQRRSPVCWRPGPCADARTGRFRGRTPSRRDRLGAGARPDRLSRRAQPSASGSSPCSAM